MNNNNSVLCGLIISVVVVLGFFAGYYFGYRHGESINTLNIGPDYKIKWHSDSEHPKPHE